jgi:anti-sigma factor RsiW
MNCAHWEERIALYMGSDLPPAEAAEVERHLAECAGCQLFASGMRESLAVLREAHGDEPGEAAYAAVRARVLGELQRPARGWWFGLAAAMAAAALLLALWMRPVKRPAIARHAPPAPQQVVVPAPAVVPELAVVPVVHHPRHHKAPVVKTAAQKAPALPEKPLVVKLVTDDPDVVIYWITDTRGEYE